MRKCDVIMGILILLSACGCTQNNGHLGPLFGSWSLMEISEDGTSLQINDETVFSFQNEVVRVLKVTENPYYGDVRYGNFTITDKTLSLTFMTELASDWDNYRFLMPSWLYFPQGEMPLRFEIRTLKDNCMVLALDNGGKTYVYSFSKTW